jgi:hypothetical protein
MFNKMNLLIILILIVLSLLGSIVSRFFGKKNR